MNASPNRSLTGRNLSNLYDGLYRDVRTIKWKKLKKSKKIKDHNLKTAVARLKEGERLFKEAIGKGINMSKTISKMSQHLKSFNQKQPLQ